jgi:hypothetical protein
MKEAKESLQVGVSLTLTETPQSETQAWKAPTLMTWKIEEETLGGGGSGPDGAGQIRDA